MTIAADRFPLHRGDKRGHRPPHFVHNTPRAILLMVALPARLQADLTAARRAQDKAQLLVLGSIVSDAKNREIELKRDLTDDDVTEVLRRGIKRRRESLDMYEKGGR